MACQAVTGLLAFTIGIFCCANEIDAIPSRKDDVQCGYQSCTEGKAGMLNVHIVPHTHDDVGWLKTVDQYYYGANNSIDFGGVQYILDTVLQELIANPARRFIYVEIAFFTRWWNELDDMNRHTVKSLVNQGRLEFVNGGWCMNDEATPHYSAIIDQMTHGLNFLQTTFGECGRPRVAWELDPFGHSSTQASIFAQMGYDGLFIGRLDYQDKAKRQKDKTMEEVWRSSPLNLGPSSDLFTGEFYESPGPPRGFCYDFKCSDQPIMDDPSLEDYNVDERVDTFIKYVKKEATNYTTNNILMGMGSGFSFGAAHHNFKNLDKLIKYVNEKQSAGSSVNLFYSTPSCYLYAVNKAEQTYSVKTDDFFPYASSPHQYWTGYFTSRPALKYYVQKSNNFLQACKQLDTLARLGPMDQVDIETLKGSLGVAQHHDAVSGTEKQHVAYDYAKRLYKGVAECQNVVDTAYKKLMPKNSSTPAIAQFFCPLLNVSSCNVTELSKYFTVTVYNPVAHSINSTVRLPVVGSTFTVVGPDGVTKIPTQVVPITNSTSRIPGRNSTATHELIFIAQSVPALGWNTYFVSKLSGTAKMATKKQTANAGIHPTDDFQIKNEHITLEFDANTGQLKTLSNLDESISLLMNQAFFWYRGMGPTYDKREFNQSSGAYVFRPNGTMAHALGPSSGVVYKGELVQEVYQTYAPWLQQVVRLYKGEQHAEFEWTVGPIPIADGIGKEIITRFDSKMLTSGVFYTSNNGKELTTRKLNHRDTWHLNITEPVAGNYYPVNGQAIIKDSNVNAELSVQNDRPQGAASLSDGNIEFMVHRRLLFDDHFGVGEPLNETGISGKGLVIRGSHKVVLRTKNTAARLYREIGYQQYMSPVLSFSPMKSFTPSTYAQKYRTTYSGLKVDLPRNVNILTLEQWHGTSVLLRLEHIFEKSEDAKLSLPISVNLQQMFSRFDVVAAEEWTLAANQLLKNATRLHWKTATEAESRDFHKIKDREFVVKLEPTEVRTFVLTLNDKST